MSSVHTDSSICNGPLKVYTCKCCIQSKLVKKKLLNKVKVQSITVLSGWTAEISVKFLWQRFTSTQAQKLHQNLEFPSLIPWKDHTVWAPAICPPLLQKPKPQLSHSKQLPGITFNLHFHHCNILKSWLKVCFTIKELFVPLWPMFTHQLRQMTTGHAKSNYKLGLGWPGVSAWSNTTHKVVDHVSLSRLPVTHVCEMLHWGCHASSFGHIGGDTVSGQSSYWS